MFRGRTLLLAVVACSLTIGQVVGEEPEDALATCDEGCYSEVNSCACDDPGWCGLGSDCMSAFALDVVYTSDTFSNTKGGISTGTDYIGLLDVVLRTDLCALGMDSVGGSVVLHGQNKHGPFLNDLVGSTQSTNIDAEPFTAMAEYYWERDTLDGDAIWRIGRQVGAIQFSVLDLAADFTYGAFQVSPNNPLPWYPNPTVAATVELTLTEELGMSVGAFNGGTPDQLTSWGWSDEGKVFSIGEGRYKYSVNDLPGDLQAGLWYSSGSHDAVDGGNPIQGNYGVYMGWGQLVMNEACNPDQGLGVFFIYSLAPEDCNKVTNHYATGLLYRGLLPNRDDDEVGAGLSIADFNDELNGFQTEDTIEVFYLAQVTEKFFIQPDLRYVANPGGVHPDAFLAGFRFGWEL